MGARTGDKNVMCSYVQSGDNGLQPGDPLTTPATSADKLISSFFLVRLFQGTQEINNEGPENEVGGGESPVQ